MPEIGTSSSMSGDGKRSVGHRPQATAPVLDSTIKSIPGLIGMTTEGQPGHLRCWEARRPNRRSATS